MTDEPQLQKFLDHVAAGRGGTVTMLRPISGGYSRLSALATVRWADGSEETFVLRSDPPPDTGVFDSDRDSEWRLLEAISGKLLAQTFAKVSRPPKSTIAIASSTANLSAMLSRITVSMPRASVTPRAMRSSASR